MPAERLARRFKRHIANVQRYRTSLGRDLEGLRLDRNERVEPLPVDVVRDMLAQFTPAQLAAHPESDALVQKIATFVGKTADHVYLLNGITEGISFLYATLARAGDNAVVLDPTYPMYRVY